MVPSRAAPAGIATSTYVTSAGVVFFGWNSADSASSRSSGTLTTPMFGAARPPEKPPVSA